MGSGQCGKDNAGASLAHSPLPTAHCPLPWSQRDLAVWHPFTAMSAYADEVAPVIAAAEGFFLIDTAGRKYLDGHSSLWCNIHGHRVPEIDAAIREQLDCVAHSTLLGLGNTPSIELAEDLLHRVPAGLTRVFYADCGAAGVEVALKIAWQYHRQKPSPEPREMFACLSSAYHGDTVGTISLGGIDRFHSLFGGLMFPALRLPSPAFPPLSLDECLAETERLLTANAERIAGVVVEPLVQAAAGIRVHPPGYLSRLREITQRLGILLIADEIAVGFGRLGTLFACEQEHVSPDILILSKGLTGGYLPLAATLVTEPIYEAFLGDPWLGRTFYHGHTYTGNPLACAAARASLRLIEERDVLGQARRIEALLAEFATMWRTVPHVADVRHRGTMIGIDVQLDPAHGTPFPPERRAGHQLTLACRECGVIVRNIGDTLVLMPAPAMPLELVTQLCETVTTALRTLSAD
jgi:adenosylmethionine---8-amino-7-oxononanoate aminotransferase